MSQQATKCEGKKLNTVLSAYIDTYDENEKKKLEAILKSLNLQNTDTDIEIKIKLMLLTRCIRDKGYFKKGTNELIFSNINEIRICLEDNLKNSKGNCDLDLFDLIILMRLDILVNILSKSYYIDYVNQVKVQELFSKSDEKIKFNKNIIFQITDNDDYKDENKINPIIDKKGFIGEIYYKQLVNIINLITKEQLKFNIDEKIQIYTLLYVIIKNLYTENEKVNEKFKKIVLDDTTKCAPRSFIDIKPNLTGGKKSNNIEYHICKANFKHTFKKVSGTSAREGAKKIAKKVLIGNKKSIKFSLKRMIGNKEKCYDYIASIEKGNIIIKNQ